MYKTIATVALAALLTACGSSDFEVPSSPPVVTPPPAPTKLSFSQFVKDQVNNTTDTRTPVDINQLDFEFDAEDDPQAFDSLFGDGT
ncbi:MAG: hypothetical protein HKN49_06040 [Gammaproteobacteria bacterium]|nr:hypothetical protein [Gammaproteobacteria bacterium]